MKILKNISIQEGSIKPFTFDPSSRVEQDGRECKTIKITKFENISIKKYFYNHQ